ncbi:hypothetical protein B0H15DRAFT_826962 [Mycena belliarum]|uniref:Uncharacterized protein n=1 Tax=Mycena belliarum TaxID=1033014 RepID=A0AAD6UC31_9AGAR|nr:hypothetical protein B0H15DRAFT_826962 [Mycena belliae]
MWPVLKGSLPFADSVNHPAMDDSDNSWCAVCDRQIVPTRSLVVVDDPQPIEPARRKQQALRQRSGLVHGTGRVRPNGTLKAPPPKTRVEIDQGPAPLYCSDACRQKDTEYFHGSRPTFDDSASSSSGSSGSGSLASLSPEPRSKPTPPRKSTPNTRSLAVLQREYDMPPLPPRTSETYDELAPRAPRPPPVILEYTSGVMMANRRLEAVLPKALKPGEPVPPLKPIPGWTDGSQAWRASTYSFAPPPRTRADILDPNRAAYQSFVASPHRSAASGVTASAAPDSPPSPTAPSCSSVASSANSELLSSFENSFTRRTSSRLSLFTPSSTPASSVAGSPPRKSRPMAAASSMLLVPDVLLRPAPSSNSSSCDSLSSLGTASSERNARRHSAGAESFPGARAARRLVRSPLARPSMLSPSEPEAEDPEEAAYVRDCAGDSLAFLPPLRPKPEMRSWSYDNVRTYPVMMMPALKERRVVDGVEIEVEVPRPFKKLFTFEPVAMGAR